MSSFALRAFRGVTVLQPQCSHSNGLLSCLTVVSSRWKHWDPKYRRLRGRKVIKISLPDYDEQRLIDSGKLTADEMRAKLKEKGIAPPRRWTEKPIFISCTGAVFEPYVPPEGDGKISLVSSEGVKQKYVVVEKKSKTYMALRKIRNFEYDFDVPSMAEKAHEIYLNAHNSLAEKDEDKLHELVTEKCFTEMMDNVKNKTVRWKFIQSLEFPRVVHMRCQELSTDCGTFAQSTVRFHTQQTLAVYDRFGRLMHGSEDHVKDVLEYVVFEKHLTNQYGAWRIHGKIIPDWMPSRDGIRKTFHKPHVEPDPPTSAQDVANDEESGAKNPQEGVQQGLTPSFA